MKIRHLINFAIGLVGVLIIAIGLSLFPATTANPNFYYSVTDLGTLGGNYSEANDLNDRGQVVGSSTLNNPNFIRHAFLWENGSMIDLGTLGGKTSNAYAINNTGQVVGQSDTANDPDGGARHAFLWHNNTMTALGTLGGNFSFAFDINDKGQVVGDASTTSGSHAFFWDNGTMTDLGTLVGDTYSSAMSLNNTEQIVGSSFVGDLSSPRRRSGSPSLSRMGRNDRPTAVIGHQSFVISNSSDFPVEPENDLYPTNDEGRMTNDTKSPDFQSWG